MTGLKEYKFKESSKHVKKTMKIAQELYEGVHVDEYGTTGLITYMRTDSTRLSEESVNKIS